MDTTNLFYLIIMTGIAAMILEILLGAATGFDILLVGIILVIAGVVGLLTGSLPLVLIFIAVLAILYVFIGRRFVKKQLITTPRLTNIDAVIGKSGVVVKPIIPPAAGQVTINSEVWRAESLAAIDVGEHIIVRSISGVTLRVEKN